MVGYACNPVYGPAEKPEGWLAPWPPYDSSRNPKAILSGGAVISASTQVDTPDAASKEPRKVGRNFEADS